MLVPSLTDCVGGNKGRKIQFTEMIRAEMFNPINEFANWPSAPNHFIDRLLQHEVKWKQIQGRCEMA